MTSKAAVLTTNAMTILEKRYLEGGTVNQMWDRVSGRNEVYRELMSSLRGIPNSPALFNLGKGNGCTSSACFTLDVQDSMFGKWSIVDVRNKAIAIAKAGGGVGYYFGNLRPKGAAIKSIHRKACGPVSVLKDYHAISRLITQGGKRELAQLGALNCDHPDIDEFIHCKNDDPQGLGSFNISVSWTNNWIGAVDFNPPKDGKTINGPTKLWWDQCKSAWKTGCPGMLFYDTINKANYNKHLGLINCTNPCAVRETLVAVADGRGSVSIGELADAGIDVPVYCQDDNGKITIRMMRHPRLTGINKPIVKVTLDNGECLRVTTNHKFKLRSGKVVEAQYLKEGDSLSVMTRYIPTDKCGNSSSRPYRYINMEARGGTYYEHELIASFFAGRDVVQGEHVHHIDENRLNNSPENLEILDGSKHLSDHSTGLTNPNSDGVTNEELIENGRLLTRHYGRRFSTKEWIEFARDNGLPTKFSKYRLNTIGSIQTLAKKCAELEGFTQYIDENPKLVKTYQEALEAGYDAEIINKDVYIKKACECCGDSFTCVYFQRERGYCSKSCSNRVRDTTKQVGTFKETVKRKHALIRKQQLEVFLSLKQRFARDPMRKEWINECKLVGISPEVSRKSSPFPSWDDLVEAAHNLNHRVVFVEPDGNEDVYNGTVDDFHNYYVGGWDEGVTNGGNKRIRYINTLNCGEVPNRGTGEPCNLMSLALPRYFEKGNRSINWKLLEQDIWNATMFMDDILDRNEFPHPDITESAELTRRLGLGVMGWADLLALMHIHYDTEEALQLGHKVMSLFEEVSHAASEEMAKTKGPYKGYDPVKTEAPCRRNETNTCNAPTGTISIIAGCWGGIEPYFSLRCERTTSEGMKLQDGIQDWVWDQLDGFVPKTADQIPVEWHVRHQATFQSKTDLACSKTINLPNSATVEDVSRAYQMMHTTNCKGGTIFRDGCRNEQVLVKKEKTKSVYQTGLQADLPTTTVEHNRISETVASMSDQEMSPKPKKKRKSLPDEVPSLRLKVKINDVKVYIHIGLDEQSQPWEIFFRASRNGSTFNGLLDTWAVSLSLLLQAGVPLATICSKYKGSRFEPAGLTSNKDVPICSSIADFLAQWLYKRFVVRQALLNEQPHPTSTPAMAMVANGPAKENGESKPIRSGQMCPDCGSEMIHMGGCLQCIVDGCNYSKCG